MTYKSYISKTKNIRYIVIFDNNQHPFYIYDLVLTKIINFQKCEKLYSINKYGLRFYFDIPFSGNSHKYDRVFKKKCSF
jgi:hypothetical protein